MNMPSVILTSYSLLASFSFALKNNISLRTSTTTAQRTKTSLQIPPTSSTLILFCFPTPPTVAKFKITTVGIANTDDAVYGEFMCRGDVPQQVCQDCVKDASNRIASECLNNKETIIWYDECLVRYSNRSFFPTLDEQPTASSFLDLHDVSNTHDSITPDVFQVKLRITNKTRRSGDAEPDANFRRVINKT